MSEPVDMIMLKSLAIMGGFELNAILNSSAVAWGRRAVSALARAEWTEVSLASGLALEHLAKSSLISEAPERLVWESNKFPGSPDYIRGAGHPRIGTPLHLRTVQLREAVRAAFDVGDLHFDASDDRDLEFLIEVRNSAAHLGYANMDAAAAALGCFTRLSAQLLSARPVQSDVAAWLDLPEPLTLALTEIPFGAKFQDRTPIDSASLASASFKRAQGLANVWRSASHWEDVQQTLLTLKNMASPHPSGPTGSDVEHLPCPTGGHYAVFYIHNDFDDPDDSETDTRIVSRQLATVDCAVCGLHLEGIDQLQLVGLDTEPWTEEWD